MSTKICHERNPAYAETQNSFMTYEDANELHPLVAKVNSRFTESEINGTPSIIKADF